MPRFPCDPLADLAGAAFGTLIIAACGALVWILTASLPANGATLTVTTTVEPAPVSITAEPTAGITLSSEDIEAFCDGQAECRLNAEDVQQWLETRNSK